MKDKPVFSDAWVRALSESLQEEIADSIHACMPMWRARPYMGLYKSEKGNKPQVYIALISTDEGEQGGPELGAKTIPWADFKRQMLETPDCLNADDLDDFSKLFREIADGLKMQADRLAKLNP